MSRLEGTLYTGFYCTFYLFLKEFLIVIFSPCRPKQGWLYGMLMNGKVGYLLEDHVTEFNTRQWDKNGQRLAMYRKTLCVRVCVWECGSVCVIL